MKARLIEAGDGEQILIFPPGFEMPGECVLLELEEGRLVISPADPELQDHLET